MGDKLTWAHSQLAHRLWVFVTLSWPYSMGISYDMGSNVIIAAITAMVVATVVVIVIVAAMVVVVMATAVGGDGGSCLRW
ncbi:hypothetical protein EKG38_24745 [Shewanella canadensis]|uniref:Uncharacterized protein n=1 Tax=Shewanella canadensis TaxID=271096 RepID=A0A3S0LHB3_9GAMM|nr:hypothetical protein [Shewanella canadensis]RTR35481.1 hypothetical protein EKG38_24745 [Shewanella canadensis]